MISIIIPVYNAELYIDECIKSILSQTVSDWELILVDDGSKDKSLVICDEYAKTDKRITSIHIDNSGPSYARNVALKQAKGEWVLFVDADDWLDDDTLELTVSNPQADIIFFGFKRVRPDKIECCKPLYHGTATNIKEIDEKLSGLLNDKNSLFGFTWNKFFKRNIITANNLSFNKSLKIKEDELFCLMFVSHITNLVVADVAPYNYRIIDNSLSHRLNTYRNYAELARSLNRVLPIISYQKLRERFAALVMEYYISSAAETIKFNRNELHKKIVKESISFYTQNKTMIRLPSWLKLFYKIKSSFCVSKVLMIRNLLPIYLIKYLKFLYYGGYKSLKPHNIYYSVKINSCGYGLIVGKRCKFIGISSINLGNQVNIRDYASLFCNQINSTIPKLTIGSNVLIGEFCSIGCSNSITIGNNVMLAPHVHITDRNHTFEDINTPINRQPCVSQPVSIGDESWLGYGSQIMPGVTIGKHCVIAAGAIVTKDIPDYSIAAGMPAKIIKQYNFETSKWEKN